MATGRLGAAPVLKTRWTKEPTAGTTSLSGLDANSVSLVYSVGYEQVYRNGVLLSRGNDYTATDGTTITLTDATITGDIIEVFANELIPLSDAIGKGQYNAKGALVSASAASTPATLAVGNNGDTLVADSSTTTGLRWQGSNAAGKNRIINGNMNIDQRFSGTTSSSSGYTLDRWTCFRTTANGGTFTTQKVEDAPAGFTNSLKASNVSNSTTSIVWIYQQLIEGFNVQDFNLGSASAATFTLSFWVKSTTTGTYSGCLANGISGSDRSYVFNYTISSANTWEKKTITITGDTTGTWYKDNRVGLKVLFSIGRGGGEGTLNTWAGADNVKTAGSTGLDNVTNASWQITGVQLELGSVATPFTTATGTLAGELAACKRYYTRVTATGSNQPVGTPGVMRTTAIARIQLALPVTMRVGPTSLDYSGLAIRKTSTDTSYALTAFTLDNKSTDYITVDATIGNTFSIGDVVVLQASTNEYWGVSAEL